MLKEFREFALKGNAIDMAVGIIIGTAFGAIVNSMVNDLIMPPIGMLLGNVDFSNIFITLKEGTPLGPYSSISQAAAAGAVTLNIGLFINRIISFVIVAFSVFALVTNMYKLQFVNTLAPKTSQKNCPECDSRISSKAKRCPFCQFKPGS